jgi:glycopeptide antibiotics resistance protein
LKGRSHKFTVILFLAYFIVLIKLIVFKGTSISSFENYFSNYHWQSSIQTGYATANFIPVKTLYYYLSLQEDAQTGFQNIGGNILLFIPYGFLLSLAFDNLRNTRKFILAVFATSLFFETLQLIFALGNFDVDDLLLNTLGGLVGFGFFLLVTRQRKHARS